MIMPANHSDQPDSHNPGRILIVDNNVVETGVLQLWLRQQGFCVDVATDSLQAVSRVRMAPYRLVLIDMNLGRELGGFEVLWLLKTLVNGTRIALMSREITEDHIHKAVSYGVLHWISKPLNAKTTPSEIAQALHDNSDNRYSRVADSSLNFW